MVADGSEQTRMARPSGLHAALQNAAQLPFSVAAGIADEVAYQTESLGPASRGSTVDSRQLYHESNSDMRRSDPRRAQREMDSRNDTQHQKPDIAFSHLIAHQSAAAPAASVDDTEGSASKMMQAADRDSQHTDIPLRVKFGPKKSVSIKNTVDAIGEGNTNHKPAKSHLVAARDTPSDDSNSTSSSVCIPLSPRNLVTSQLLPDLVSINMTPDL